MKKLLLILLCLPMIGFGQDSDTSSTVLYIPNCFSPNNDGVNDIFYPKGKSISEFTMKIYSRRGEEIFYSEDIDFGWDGCYNSTTVTNEVDCLTKNINKIGGIYIYIINVVDALNKTFTYTGKITLIN
jgi:gliding motility-associated-like protein